MPDWITDSQDEQTLEEMLRDADQIHIPIFQRSYVWKQKQFDELCQDIRLLKDGVEESQFLGAIVTYERQRQHEVVGRLRALAIVDGQQRLLTLYIFVMAIVEALAPLDEEDAAEVVQEFLLLPSRRGLDTNTRVVPAYTDRSQFRVLWDRINTPRVLQEKLQNNPPRPPSPSGNGTGDLVTQYERILSYIRKSLPHESEEKISYLRELLGFVTRHLTFVHLQLKDASSATKIFERLNFRGVRVGIVDLVRNEVFSRVSDDPGEAIRLFHDLWQPFEDKFDGHSEGFFFPYCLIYNSNTKKSEIFNQLRAMWNDRTPEEIVAHMVPLQTPYMSIESTSIVPGSEAMSAQILRLRRLRRPSVTYPFLMRLLNAFDIGEKNEEETLSVLQGVETFLVRRAIVGYEPTGLHALFKGLWEELDEFTPAGLAAVVRGKPTIQWPTDGETQAAVLTRSLAKSKICGFLLQEYDRHLPGDVVTEEPSIEHVLPQSYDPNGPWAALFTREQHKNLKDTLANIIPLSVPLNSSLQASEFSAKRERYRSESMFVTPRNLAENYDEWTPETIAARAAVLAMWVLETWPNP
jgi:hypothetical protein